MNGRVGSTFWFHVWVPRLDGKDGRIGGVED